MNYNVSLTLGSIVYVPELNNKSGYLEQLVGIVNTRGIIAVWAKIKLVEADRVWHEWYPLDRLEFDLVTRKMT